MGVGGCLGSDGGSVNFDSCEDVGMGKWFSWGKGVHQGRGQNFGRM